MANTYMKKCSTFLGINEMQIKIKLRFYFTAGEPLSSRKQKTNIGEDSGRKNPYTLLVGM
jgi:hypothetical protein